MKLSKAKKAILAQKLTDLATNVAKKPVYVISTGSEDYHILEYYTKEPIVQHIPSKNLARMLCDSLNKAKKRLPIQTIQHYINVYSKHYYDCVFYKNTIKNTKDVFKKQVTITRLDISIEYLKMAAAQIRKTC